MDKEEVTLSTTHWTSKLLAWCWGIRADEITNLCPYFWLVLLSIFFLPIDILLWRPISWMSKRIKKRSYQGYLKNLGKSDLYYLYEIPHCSSFVHGYFLKRTDLRYPKKNILRDAIEAQGINVSDIKSWRDEFLLKAVELEDKKKKKIPRLVRFGEVLLKTITGVLSVVLGWIFSTLLIMVVLISDITESWFVVTLILSYLLIFLVFTGDNPMETLKKWKELKWYQYPRASLKIALGSPIMWFVGGVISFFGILGKYIKAAYHDYCPGINWKKDDN